MGQGDLAGAAGNMAQALAPNQIQRAVQFWRDDNEFRRKDGSLIDGSSDVEKAAYSILGIKPTRVANAQERDNWQRIDAEIEQDERNQWIDDTIEKLKEGDSQSVREAILKRAETKPGESLNGIANAIGTKYVEAMTGKDPRRSPGYSERLGLVTGAPGTQISESQRLMMLQKVLQSIGFGVPNSRFRNAAMVDSMRTQRPWMPYQDAMDQVR